MIDIKEKKHCCGCYACIQICPQKCIEMIEDEEGFLYPHVNDSLCIGCNLCERVCQVINRSQKNTADICYASKCKDENIRKHSSSGGVFSVMAKYVIEKGGVVFGAVINRELKVVHTCIEKECEIKKIRGSKYVQSDLNGSFQEAEKYLKMGLLVLFTGTPCQILGLKRFLRKDYENLIAVDFICHGVPSPGIFRWYIQEELNNYARRALKNSVSLRPIHSIPKSDVIIPDGIEVNDIRFRDKKEGWKKFSFALDLAETTVDGKKNSVSLSSNLRTNPFLVGFIADLFLRPSCHYCPTKEFRSGSDITIGDFWGQDIHFPEFDNDTGVSAIIPISEKGKQLLRDIELDIEIVKRPFEDLILHNPSLISSKKIPRSRKRFWSNYGKYDFETTVFIACTPSLMERLFARSTNLLKKLLNK